MRAVDFVNLWYGSEGICKRDKVHQLINCCELRLLLFLVKYFVFVIEHVAYQYTWP